MYRLIAGPTTLKGAALRSLCVIGSILMLGACGTDGTLFPEIVGAKPANPDVDPAGGPNSLAPEDWANRPLPNGSTTNRPTSTSSMRLILDPETGLDENLYSILFKDQAFDPFRAQAADVLAKALDATLKLVRVNQFTEYSEVQADGELTIRTTLDGSVLIGTFVSSEPLVVKRVGGSSDSLEGTLKEARGRGVVLKLDLLRPASDTAEQANRNPWNGFIRVTRGGEDLKLGRISGPSR